MIARLLTQRALLGFAAALVRHVAGPVWDVGLGKGRTYTHLRLLFPDRAIWAFDRDVHAPAHSRPPGERTILGELKETLPAAAASGAPPAFVHADIGTDAPERDLALARFVGEVAGAAVAPGGVLLGDRDMAPAVMEPVAPPAVDLPAGVSPWPYFVYRKPV